MSLDENLERSLKILKNKNMKSQVYKTNQGNILKMDK